MFRYVVGAIFIASISGCGGGNGDTPKTEPILTPKERVAALESGGNIPKLDRSAILIGADTNMNGIRDDVDAFIAEKYQTQIQNAAAQQFSAVVQAAISMNKADLVAVKALSIRGTRAVNCIYSKFDGAAGSKQPSQVVEELRAVSTNTKARLLAYLSYSKALDGTSGALPEGDTCE
jgi:hypothetical protein